MNRLAWLLVLIPALSACQGQPEPTSKPDSELSQVVQEPERSSTPTTPALLAVGIPSEPFV